MLSLTRGQKIPKHLLQENASRGDNDFDPNAYFSTLTHLSMQPGYALDYVYFYEWIGAKPLLYARPVEQPRYQTYADFLAAIGEGPEGERSYNMSRHALDYLQYVQTDDTAEGYLQLAILATMGDQFYLWWHANYNDAVPMCGDTAQDLKTIESQLAPFDLELPAPVRWATRAADRQPAVTLQEDRAVVRLVVFTKWGGLVEIRRTFSRTFPHRLLDEQQRALVGYNCRIMF